jgi:hypothetical protein
VLCSSTETATVYFITHFPSRSAGSPAPCPSYEQRGLSEPVYIDGQAQASSDIPER